MAGIAVLQLPALRAQAFSPLAPLLDTTVAVALGAIVLHEQVGWPLLAGGALVMTATVLANQAPTAPAVESP